MKQKVKAIWDNYKDCIAPYAFLGSIGIALCVATYAGAKAGFNKAFKTWTIQPVMEFKLNRVE